MLIERGESMPYDFNVLVVNQREKTILPFSSSISVLNEIDDEDGKRYHTIYPFMTQTSGIWYSLIKEDDGVVYASFCDSDFEHVQEDTALPYWMKDEDVKYHLTPLIIKKGYEEDVVKIISYLIEQSPIKTVMLLARYQSEDREIICGVISPEEFWTLLGQGKVLFNTCYIIRKE
ncbi:hypothetical protein [Paenibacillus rubinfantis]|uniref:hypothetical protein n=1 Tax=Paenibacillus rubinfantis TaxID=1720296 RepID=UPI0018DF8E38|nr:hypothetical protein [Paenibacillus rubinfantis]